MLPDFSLVKTVLAKKQQEYFKDCIRLNSGNIFSNVPENILHEGDQMMSIYSKELKYEIEIKKMESSYTHNIEDVLKHPFLIYKAFFKMAKDFADQQEMMVMKTISEVSTLTGNVHQTKGEVTPEDILSMYEKVEFSFDDNGRPNIPSIVAGSKMYKQISEVLEKMKDDEDFGRRFEEIVIKQRKNWNDRENNRQLVD